MMEKENKIVRVKSIDKAIKILTIIANKKNGLKLKDIAERMEMSVSSTHHIVQTLATNNLLFKNQETGNYCLGVYIGELGNKYYSHLTDTGNLLFYMKKLHSEFNETVNLIVIENENYVIAESISTNHSLRPVVLLTEKQMHASAWGKIVLANMEDSELEKYLRSHEFIKYTKNTIDNTESMMKEINKIRNEKIAFDNQEYELGLYCLGIPVYGFRNRLVGTIVMMTPETRVKNTTLDRMRDAMLSTLEDIEDRFGRRGSTNSERIY